MEMTDSITVFFIAICCKGLTLCYKQIPLKSEAKTDYVLVKP